MDKWCFDWKEPIDEALQHLKNTALKQVCKLSLSHQLAGPSGQTRENFYEWIASQDASTQGFLFNEFQKLLAFPDSWCCKQSWLKKRKLEEEDANTRNVRMRLDNLTNSLFPQGMDYDADGMIFTEIVLTHLIYAYSFQHNNS